MGDTFPDRPIVRVVSDFFWCHSPTLSTTYFATTELRICCLVKKLILHLHFLTLLTLRRCYSKVSFLGLVRDTQCEFFWFCERHARCYIVSLLGVPLTKPKNCNYEKRGEGDEGKISDFVETLM
jgi:hypothetical protein